MTKIPYVGTHHYELEDHSTLENAARQALETENRRLRATVHSLESALRTAHRVLAPYADRK